MITSDGWLEGAIRHPGPLHKTNGSRNGMRGFVAHSAEGYHDAILSILANPHNQKSWTFSNMKDGRLYQHYSVWEQVWASGSSWPNDNCPAMEHEGVAGQPLTEAQIANTRLVISELFAISSRTVLIRNPSNYDAQEVFGLYEHRECTRFGSAPTACPSGRIPWHEMFPATPVEPPPNYDQIFTENAWKLVRALATGKLVAVPKGEGLVTLHRVIDGQGQPFDLNQGIPV